MNTVFYLGERTTCMTFQLSFPALIQKVLTQVSSASTGLDNLYKNKIIELVREEGKMISLVMDFTEQVANYSSKEVLHCQKYDMLGKEIARLFFCGKLKVFLFL